MLNLKTMRISGIHNSQDVIQDVKSNGFVKKMLLVCMYQHFVLFPENHRVYIKVI